MQQMQVHDNLKETVSTFSETFQVPNAESGLLQIFGTLDNQQLDLVCPHQFQMLSCQKDPSANL